MGAPSPVRWSPPGRCAPPTGTSARSSPAGPTMPPGAGFVSSLKDRHDGVYRRALGAASAQCSAHCHRVSLHGARRAETAGLAGPDAQPARLVLADRRCGSARIVRRPAPARRLVHAAPRFYSFRRDGIRLFHGARRHTLVAPAEPRGTGDALLLRIPLSRGSGRRAVEPRPCVALAQINYDRQLLEDPQENRAVTDVAHGFRPPVRHAVIMRDDARAGRELAPKLRPQLVVELRGQEKRDHGGAAQVGREQVLVQKDDALLYPRAARVFAALRDALRVDVDAHAAGAEARRSRDDDPAVAR